MNGDTITLAGETLRPLPSGALFWPRRTMLVVSDLHLGKSERIARTGGTLLPPYDTTETLARLAADVDSTRPQTILCLGDSFDDPLSASALDRGQNAAIARLQEGRRWIWVEGNHDPGSCGPGGLRCPEHREGPLTFRHIAAPDTAPGEVSGHFHPKARLRGAARPCFLADEIRLMLPAYGAYTGGLCWSSPELQRLFAGPATAYLTGRRLIAVPMPRAA